MLKKTIPYIVAGIIVVLMIWGRVVAGAGSEYNAGSELLAKGDTIKAIHHFDRAIHWYSPFSSSVNKSIEKIKGIAAEYEAAGDDRGALYAYRVLRSAIYSIRHFRQPYPDVISLCDEKIAGYMALSAGVKGSDEFAAEYEKRHGELTVKVGPRTGFALLAQGGFYGWVICTLLFIWLGIRPDSGFNKSRAVLFAVMTLVFYAFWIIGMAKA